MLPKNASREAILEILEDEGGLRAGVAARVERRTGVPAADVYGVATFYHLLNDPDAGVRVCQGLSCKIAGCDAEMARLEAAGTKAVYTACLGRCDVAPALWDPQVEAATPAPHFSPSDPDFAIDLLRPDCREYQAFAAARERGAEWVLAELEASGLTGRGGAGFPAHIKWRGVRGQPVAERYVVLNADEGEPGTFKDREVILRRPHLVVEGLAIAAYALAAGDVYCYVRGEFGHVKAALVAAVDEARAVGVLDPAVRWHFVDGHGAYICGEETALLEALEGKRGMPRMKPPFPVEVGFRGKPTLIQNVETIACLPAILGRGGEWFRSSGRTQPGSKLYCLSGHVARPGVYEAPMGVSMRELLALAGGVVGELKAFSPGGASSGFLPAGKIDVAMDFQALAAEGSMLGSAGVVVLNDTADMVDAALTQAVFFEDESCGQCAPCRIGTQILRQALERYRDEGRDPETLSYVADVAWGMREASICGLGQAASLPLESAMKYFPEEFGLP
ncbi:MAG: NAD(P)H-dependent oxidoreductase subunit E [Acidobacteriota bacterium]|nr:NAD(P)H-dependent oxidoreductase subunit E [Acidobacteriota bacterium]MDH3523298.1 NAD(P)H-dependent oxidoreductase subunit E [Acidobacteriota bacterium]